MLRVIRAHAGTQSVPSCFASFARMREPSAAEFPAERERRWFERALDFNLPLAFPQAMLLNAVGLRENAGTKDFDFQFQLFSSPG